MNSAERIKYITEYVSAYEAKITLANKNGLFDTATLFELFAINVCRIWFGQNFYNLNEKRSNYPYVDLVSEDNTIYVQVSTAKDVAKKIKSTLEKIKESNDKQFGSLQKVFFFVLNNSSVGSVKDYTGKDKIGRIDFKKDEHLITTQDVVSHAKNDLSFQKELYELLKSEDTKICEISNGLDAQFRNSKEIGLSDITSLINGEYEIDRSSLVDTIKKDNHQFISVRGEAGSGKSVVCKKVVENMQYLLYARAERFVEETDINNIWHLCIADALQYMQDKPVTFFVDSLEFIADAPSTKLDLLQSLFKLIKQYPNAKLITSCRSSDQTAFAKIDSKYSVGCFLVEPLNADEIYQISKKYPIIRAFINDNAYSALVSIPFYINLLVCSVSDYTCISDENKLREYIWENVICIGKKAKKYNLLFNDIVREVKQLTFTRAQEFGLGVSKELIDHNILSALISEGVLIENGQWVRLKYDIFEDICFEREFDDAFVSCRGEYGVFFNHIEKFGRCGYRRYQIWIANKILSKENREKFLYSLISTTSIPDRWSQQTIIGLTKSRFCTPFFEEHTDSIVSNNRLQEFIDITNLYAFSPEVWGMDDAQGLILHPIGKGRDSLIKIIYDQNIYKASDINVDSIVKLCSDYAKSANKNACTAHMTCEILEYYIANGLSDHKSPHNRVKDEVTRLLNPIYQMAEFSKDWIVLFWDQQIEAFLAKDSKKQTIAEELLKYTLKYTTLPLAKYLPSELCKIADVFWTCNLSDKHFLYRNEFDCSCYDFGLNRLAEDYEHGTQSFDEYCFFLSLIEESFWEGLNWAVEFINKCISNLSVKHASQIQEITLMLLEKNEEKKLFANQGMWFAGVDEHQFPALLSDIVYVLRTKIIRVIEGGINYNKDVTKFAYRIKKIILQKTNNIAILSIIEDVGCRFEKELPGYALDLATCVEIIFWDIERFVRLNPNTTAQELETQILQRAGFPYRKQRYPANASIRYILREYVARMQFVVDLQEKCYRLLDYLYSLYPNNEQYARIHLQIQQMDLRNPDIERIDDKTVAIVPRVSGFAKNIVDAHSTRLTPEKEIFKVVNNFAGNVNLKNYSEHEILPYLEKYKTVLDNIENAFAYTTDFVLMVSCVLNKPNLEPKIRDVYCNFWLDGMEATFNGGVFLFKDDLLYVLFKQVDSNASLKVKNRIKHIILQIVMYRGMDGRIYSFGRIAKRFLKDTPSLQAVIINTIVALSKDEMQHQLFNYNYVKNCSDTEPFDFVPNCTPQLQGVDDMLKRRGQLGYMSCKNQIIEEYLYMEKNYDLTDLVADDYDLDMLCSIVNCGISIEKPQYYAIVQLLIRNIVAILCMDDSDCLPVERFDTYTSRMVTDYLGEELLSDIDGIVNALFDGIDFTQFSKDAVDFYLKVFGKLLPRYVDAYKTPLCRKQCETAIYAIEAKINAVNCTEWVRRGLYRSLILSVSGFEGDWSQVPTAYSYADIQFLNNIFSKYGKYNFSYFMLTVNKMKVKKLLPHILPSIADSVTEFTMAYFDAENLERVRGVLNYLILISYLKFSDEIKQDAELTTAYERILEALIGLRFENAAVLLDEFRVH